MYLLSSVGLPWNLPCWGWPAEDLQLMNDRLYRGLRELFSTGRGSFSSSFWVLELARDWFKVSLRSWMDFLWLSAFIMCQG